MKVLLDNCMPYRAKRLFPGHEISHAKDAGWQELVNGDLISAAADSGFVVMITIDKKIRHEHNLNNLAITVFEIDSPDSRLPEIQRLAPFILAALPDVAKFRFLSVNKDGQVERLAPRAQ